MKPTRRSSIYLILYYNITFNILDHGDSIHVSWKEPAKFDGEAGYRLAFLEGIAEHNGYGVAVSNKRYQIDDATAISLFGFKVSRLRNV